MEPRPGQTLAVSTRGVLDDGRDHRCSMPKLRHRARHLGQPAQPSMWRSVAIQGSGMGSAILVLRPALANETDPSAKTSSRSNGPSCTSISLIPAAISSGCGTRRTGTPSLPQRHVVEIELRPERLSLFAGLGTLGRTALDQAEMLQRVVGWNRHCAEILRAACGRVTALRRPADGW
jgi:hypothetical protein